MSTINIAHQNPDPVQFQSTRMFPNNLRHKELYQWLCNKTTKPERENHIDDPHPYIITPNNNSLTYNDKIEIINENDRNSVS